LIFLFNNGTMLMVFSKKQQLKRYVMLSARIAAGAMTIIVMGMLITYADSPEALVQALVPLAGYAVLIGTGLYTGMRAGFYAHEQLGPWGGHGPDDDLTPGRFLRYFADILLFLGFNIAVVQLGRLLLDADLPIPVMPLLGTFFAATSIARVTGRENAGRLVDGLRQVPALFQPGLEDDDSDDRALLPAAHTPASSNGPAAASAA